MNSTPHQRLCIRIRLRDRGLPTDRVTAAHRGLFKAAGVPFNEGSNLDAELHALTREQATALGRRLTDHPRSCRVCGCTQHNACRGGCSWVEWDLCSACKAGGA